MAECPSCRTEVATAVKCWTVAPKKQTTAGVVPEFRVGIFVCPKCGLRFRSRVLPEAKAAEPVNVKVLVERVNEIRKGLVQTLTVLRDKLKILETERSGLLTEIADLKKVAESRASNLEDEVRELRDELKGLKELLDSTEKTA